MEKYLYYYAQHSQYAKPTDRPAVSYCEQEDEIHYHPSFKQYVTIYYANIGGTNLLINPQEYHPTGNIPYYYVYDCGLFTDANVPISMTQSNGTISFSPWFSSTDTFNGQFAKVVNNIRFVSSTIDPSNSVSKTMDNYIASEHTITINGVTFTKAANQLSFNNDTVGINWVEVQIS